MSIESTVRKFALTDATFERSPGQDGDVFTANLIDERHGGPITIGYGRYAPGQTLSEAIAVHDVMLIVKGRLSVSSEGGTITAGPGEIVYMPQGTAVTIRSHDEETITAYVTHPHWRQAHT